VASEKSHITALQEGCVMLIALTQGAKQTSIYKFIIALQLWPLLASHR